MQEPPAKRESNRAAVVISIVGALVGAWFLWGFVRLRAENDPWGVGVVVALGIAAAIGFHRLQDWQSGRARRAEVRRMQSDSATTVAYDGSRFRPDRSWVVPVGILAVAAIWGVFQGNNARQYYVRPYCMYGAKSQAQLDGCMSHVTSDDINALDTHAARFGRGDTSECLENSGPFCESAAQWNGYTPDE